MEKQQNDNSRLFPVLIAVFGGGLPLLFGGDVRLFLLIILIFLGLSIIMLLVKIGIARDALLFTLGVSLIINPNKFFLTDGISMTQFGGIPVPFLSLTDLTMIALLCSHLISNKHTNPSDFKFPRFPAIALAGWVLLMSISLINSGHPAMGFWHLTFELKCIVLFFIVLRLGKYSTADQIMLDVRLLFYGISAAILVETMAVLAEYLNLLGSGVSFFGIQIGGFREALGGMTANRVGGTYRHPNYLAIPMASMLIPIAAMALRSNGFQRLLMGGAVACTVLNLLLTLSRGGWLAAAVSLLFFLSILLTTKDGLVFLRKNLKLITILAFFSFVALGMLSKPITSKLFESSDTNISGRVVLNKMGMEMIADHPLIGVGLNNSVDASDDYGLMEQFVGHSGLPPVIHNIYLLIGAEVGIPGLLCFVSFTLFLLFKGLAQARKKMNSGEVSFFLASMASGGFAYLVADLFGPGLRKLEITYLFWWHLGIVTLLTYATSLRPGKCSTTQ